MTEFAHLPLEDKIRYYAARNNSRAAVAELLGISVKKLAPILELMPDVVFAKPHHTKQYIEGHRTIAETPARTAARKKAHESRIAKLPMVELCGKRLSRRAMYRLWSEYVEVTEEAFYRRLRQGLPVFNALFDPKQDHAAAGRQRHRTSGSYNTIYKGRYDGRNRPV